MARRMPRVPKAADRAMVAFIAAGLTWIALTSHVLRCPPTPALAISTLVGGVVLGMCVRAVRPRLRFGPVRISVGAASGRSRSRSRSRPRGGRR